MSRFIAVHTMPMTEEMWKKRMSGGKRSFPPEVKWKLTYCDFADGKFFCEWEAPNKETIEQIFQGMEMPFDAIYPVQLFDFAKMTLEP